MIDGFNAVPKGLNEKGNGSSEMHKILANVCLPNLQTQTFFSNCYSMCIICLAAIQGSTTLLNVLQFF